jgi:hypothetical protein
MSYRRRAQMGFLDRTPFLVVLVVLSLAYLLFQFITTPTVWFGGATVWLKFAGVVLCFFWYAIFVMWSEHENWPRTLRRALNAILLAGLAAGAMWFEASPKELVLVVAFVGLLLGLFAEKWVRHM